LKIFLFQECLPKGMLYAIKLSILISGYKYQQTKKA
jgi:hypothetical protein